jgi:hypothetical protein
MPISHDQIDVGGSSSAQVLRASKPIHPCPPQRRRGRANTSLFPVVSTPKAVEMMVESALSP